MRATGVVAWVNDLAEAGIEFVKLSKSQARRLREWCSENQIASAAQELMAVAGGWPAAVELISELARSITGTPFATVTLSGKQSSSGYEGPSFRTTVAAPIHENEQIIGHLEVSSTELDAFDEADLRAVSMLGAVLSEMVRLRSARKPDMPLEFAPKPWFAARIVNRMEGMLPTVRVRLIL